MDVYGNYTTFVDEYLGKNSIDYLFVTCPPDNSIRLGRKLSLKHRIPLIVEFRDLWNNELLSASYVPGFTVRINDFLHAFHIGRWLRGTSLIVSISQGILDKIQKLRPELRSIVVPNGFDGASFKSFRPSTELRNQKFTFSIIGTLFPQHDLSVLTNGMKLFLQDKNLEEVQLNFIGTAGIPVVRQLLEKQFPAECTRLTERIPRNEAFEIMESSDVLFHAGWRDYKGIASGKLFEYLAARRNVLVAPCDEDIMLQLLTETCAGRPANSPEEFAAFLNEWFAEWKLNGSLKYNGKDEYIERYSREAQAATLAEAILHL